MIDDELPDWHIGTTYHYRISPNSTLVTKERIAVMCVRERNSDLFVFSELDVRRPNHSESVRQIWSELCVECTSAELAWEKWRYRHEVQEEIRWQMNPNHPDNRAALDVPFSPTDSSRA